MRKEGGAGRMASLMVIGIQIRVLSQSAQSSRGGPSRWDASSACLLVLPFSSCTAVLTLLGTMWEEMSGRDWKRKDDTEKCACHGTSGAGGRGRGAGGPPKTCPCGIVAKES